VQNVNFRDLFHLLYLLNNGGNVFKILLILLIQSLNPGKIEKIYVKEGQVVQQGDLLVQLSDIEIKTAKTFKMLFE
jgi:hypothetical protein